MKRIFLALLLLAVAAPIVTSSLGCRVSGEVEDPVD